MKKFALGLAVVALASLSLNACSDEAKDKVTDAAESVKDEVAGALSKAECAAINAGQEALAKTDDLTGDGLQALVDGASKVSDAIGALGDKVPESIQSAITDAQTKLDEAVAEAESDPEAAQAKVEEAAQGYSDSLEELKTEVGCEE